MKTSQILSVLVVTLASLLHLRGYSQAVPSAISYQGRLTDSNGINLPDGTGYEIEFRVWSTPTGGTLVWGQRYGSIPLKNGAFNVVLGASSGISIAGAQTTDLSQAFTASTRYLGMVVTKNALGAALPSPSEILPRQQFLSAPYAIKADIAAGTVDNGITTSMIGSGQVTTSDLGVGAVTSEAVKDSDIQTIDIADSAVTLEKLAEGSVSPAKLAAEFAVFYEEVSTGTDRASIAGWQKRVINNGSNSAGGNIRRSGSTITLAPGTYYVEAEAISNLTLGSQLIFRDVTLSPTGAPTSNEAKIIGLTFGATNDHAVTLPNTLKGYVVVSGDSRQFELWHWHQRAYSSGLGLGHTQGSGTTANSFPDRFSQVHIFQVK